MRKERKKRSNIQEKKEKRKVIHKKVEGKRSDIQERREKEK